MNDQQRAAMQMALENYEQIIETANTGINKIRKQLAQPQEPVFLSYDDPLIRKTIESDPLYMRGFSDAKEKAAHIVVGCTSCGPITETDRVLEKIIAAIRSMK